MASSENISVPVDAPLVCGLVMPISGIDGVGPDHWTEVKLIIQDSVDSIQSPKFTAKLVSDADDVGVIHKRIVQGIYNSDMVVCDVSARNPNVMFELGMRLAFDKPTVIIKDDKTDYAFDTSIIEHIPYPRDLRFSRIVAFKKQLADKILATYKAAKENTGHSTFLKNFGTFKVAALHQTVGSGEQVMMEMLTEIQQEVSRLRRASMQQTLIPRNRNRNSEEGKLRIRSELLRMRAENPDLAIELNDELVARMQKLLPAMDYFTYKRDFLEALEQTCASLDGG